MTMMTVITEYQLFLTVVLWDMTLRILLGSGG